MPTTYAVPTTSAVQTVLATLFPYTEVENIKNEVGEHAYLATYADENSALVAVCACDMDFAAKVASALGMMQPELAKEAVKTGKLDSELQKNLYEILHIYANLIMDESSPRLSLQQMYEQSDIPTAATRFLKNNAHINFRATLPNYGTGSFMFSIV